MFAVTKSDSSKGQNENSSVSVDSEGEVEYRGVLLRGVLLFPYEEEPLARYYEEKL